MSSSARVGGTPEPTKQKGAKKAAQSQAPSSAFVAEAAPDFVEQAVAAEQVPPVEVSAPVEANAPVEASSPAEPPVLAAETTSAEQATPATEVVSAPVAEAAPAVEVAPGEEAAPAVEVAPGEEAAPAVEVAPGEEAAPAVEVAPGEEAAPAVEVAPVDEAAPTTAPSASTDESVAAAPVSVGEVVTPAAETATPSAVEVAPSLPEAAVTGAEEAVSADAATDAASHESVPSSADAARSSKPPSDEPVPSEQVRLVLNFADAVAGDQTPPALSVDVGPLSSQAVEDEHSSFFESAEEAVAREREAVLAVLREEQKPKAPPSALQIARRHRARRLVTYVMGGAVLLFGLGSLRVAWHERGVEPANSFSPQTQVAPVVTVAPAAPAAATSSAPLPQAVASALPAPTPRSSGAVLARELADQADQSFERRRYREAIEQASRAVEADPSEAGPYLLWARALVETGQRAEAKRVFSRCLEQATKGPKDECGPGIR